MRSLAFVPLLALASLVDMGTPQTLPRIDIVAPKATISAQVARTEPQRELGLMFYRKLPAHSGMLFVFSSSGPQTFWMKNTLIPLDMVFIAVDGKVTSVAADVPATKPGTPDSMVATRAGVGALVLELNAGEAAADGIATGARLRIPPVASP